MWKMFDNIGMRKAAVFPEPVWAQDMISRPAWIIGTAYYIVSFESRKRSRLYLLDRRRHSVVSQLNVFRNDRSKLSRKEVVDACGHIFARSFNLTGLDRDMSAKVTWDIVVFVEVDSTGDPGEKLLLELLVSRLKGGPALVRFHELRH